MDDHDCNITVQLLRSMPGKSNLNVTALFVILILGVAGNGSIIYLFLKERKLRDINNAFIINLALSDLLLLIWFVPSSIFENFLVLRPFGLTFCHVLTIVTYASHDVSILSLVVLSYIRYRAVVHPLNHNKIKTCRTIATCLLIWFIAILLAIFPATECTQVCVRGLPILVHGIGVSEEIFHYHIVRCAVLYIIPLTLLCILHSIMACKLLPGKSVLLRNNSISARKAVNSRLRLGIIVIALVVIFAVGWLPRYIQVILGKYGIYSFAFNHVVNIFMALGSSLNPYALYAASSLYRLYFRKDILCCVYVRENPETTHVSMTSFKLSIYRSNGRKCSRIQQPTACEQERSSGWNNV